MQYKYKCKNNKEADESFRFWNFGFLLTKNDH